jgi:hypothetical protein
VVSIRFKPAGRVAGGTSWSSDTRVVGHIVIWQPPCPWPSTMPKPFSQPNQTSLWPSPFLMSTTAAKRAMLVPYRFHLGRNATLPTGTCEVPSLPILLFQEMEIHRFSISLWLSMGICQKVCPVVITRSAHHLTTCLVIGGSTMPHSTCCPDT